MQQAKREATTITIQARFFALYRERVGQNSLDVSVMEGATVGDLVGEVLRRYPQFAPNAKAVVVAVNREYVTHKHVLHAGDEAAFIPPVSGGQGAPCTHIDEGTSRQGGTPCL